MNPYYSSDFTPEMLSFERPGLSYEFDILCFWVTKDGRVYTAQDSGCSCPTPFEDYCDNDVESILQRMERVGSVDQAERIGEAWGYLDMGDRQKLSDWVSARLKK